MAVAVAAAVAAAAGSTALAAAAVAAAEAVARSFHRPLRCGSRESAPRGTRSHQPPHTSQISVLGWARAAACPVMRGRCSDVPATPAGAPHSGTAAASLLRRVAQVVGMEAPLLRTALRRRSHR